jgi:hypothetical protein
MFLRQAGGEVARDGFLGKFVGVAEVASGEWGVFKLFERDPAERDVDPDVIAAPLEGEAEGVASGFGISGFAEFDPFLVVEFHLADAFRVDQDEVVAADPLQAQAASVRRAAFGSAGTDPSTGSGRSTASSLGGWSVLASISASPSFDHPQTLESRGCRSLFSQEIRITSASKVCDPSRRWILKE